MYFVSQIGQPPMNALNKNNTTPYIMAYGRRNTEIEYYFIAVEQKNMIAVCAPK